MSEHSLLVVGKESIVHNQPIERLVEALGKEGYGITISESVDGLVGRVRRSATGVCLICADPPGEETLALTRELRAASDVGIVLLVGECPGGCKGKPITPVAGLESGADDCVVAPFDPGELLCRVRNLLWRILGPKQQQASRRRFAGWTLDADRRELRAPGGERQSLSAGQFQLLQALVGNAGLVMTRDQLMHCIRNQEWSPYDRYIDVLVGQVRKKFRQHDPETAFISTIHGAGYLFAPEVT